MSKTPLVDSLNLPLVHTEAYAEAGCIEAYVSMGESLSDVVDKSKETLREIGVGCE